MQQVAQLSGTMEQLISADPVKAPLMLLYKYSLCPFMHQIKVLVYALHSPATTSAIPAAT